METALDSVRVEATPRPAPRGLPRFLLREAAGSLGDLGTFVPLAVGMVQVGGLDASTLLVTSGLVNGWGGLTFGISTTVPPMKTI